MRPIGGKRLMARVQLGLGADVRRMFERLQERLTGIIRRYEGREGRIPQGVQLNMRRDVEQAIRDVFVVPGTRTVFGPDGVTALTEYGRILNRWYVRTVSDVVMLHHDWLRANMPDDLVTWLTTSPARPLNVQEAERPTLVEYAMFYNNPLAQIDETRRWVPMHRWTDERGYRLSDRIWRTSDETRRKIDLILAKGLAEGRSALELSEALEAYLIPNRAGVRTLRPYGPRFMPDGASYDAMRLARTEIARAHNQAAYLAATLNPYVELLDLARSLAGDPKCQICAAHATIGIHGQRVRPPYTMGEAIVPPNHPHCKCHLRPVVTQSPERVTADLRAYMGRGAAPVVNPINGNAFLLQLLGAALMAFAEREMEFG